MSTYVISSKLLNQTRELTPTEKVLVVAIQSLSKERGYCYATNTYLADSLGKDKTTISKSLTSLEDKGFINRFIVRDERKMVVERKVSLTKKFLSKFVEELVNTANNVAEATKQKATKVIRVSKKAIDKAKIVLNKKEEQKLDQEQPRLSAVNHNAYVNKFNRQPSQKLVDFEVGGKGHDVVLYQVILRTNISNVKTDLDSYLIGGAIKELGKNVVVDKEITSGETKKQTKVIRQESTYCDYFTRNENGLLVCKYSDEPKQPKQPQPSCEHSSTDDDHAKIERMKVLQAQLLSGNFGGDINA